MKILFSVVVLKGIGGTETSLMNLISEISSEHSIDLYVLGSYISSTTKIPSNVNVFYVNKLIGYCCVEYKLINKNKTIVEKSIIVLTKLLKRIIGYRRILRIILSRTKIKKEYDISISYSNDQFLRFFAGGCDDFVLNCTRSKHKVAWIHNDARKHGLTREICLGKYKLFDRVVNVSNSCKKIFDDIVPEYKDKSIVVTNMISYEKPIEEDTKNPFEFSNKFNILTVSRIENRQKRIDRVIECCEILKNSSFQNVHWTVVGDGPDLNKFINETREKGLEEILTFVGRKSDSSRYMRYANILVQTSDYEAYSMVLIEALSSGLPCLCTNYESVTDIIENNYNGWIVPRDSVDITRKIIEIFSDYDIVMLNFRENCIKSSKRLNRASRDSFQNLIDNLSY